MKVIKSPKDVEKLREQIIKENEIQSPEVRVCCGTACRAAGGFETYQEFKNQLKDSSIIVKASGCQGFCEKGPIVAVEPQNIFYQKVQSYDVKKIIDLTVNRGIPIQNLLVEDPLTGEFAVSKSHISFYKKQMPILLRRCGRVDPTDIRDYIRHGGYRALTKALSMTPEEVIEEVKNSRLRGRGGAGFPTGLKWQGGRLAKGDKKYVIANGDEGDPGAFMDRSIMEGDPHAVLEGMIICAYAVGNCHEGFIYVREEYPLAVNHLRIAIEQAREYGFLGENILGSGLNFDIEIRRGAGAFICGESTALMRSIEGRRGMPRVTPPRSIEVGLFGKPTVLNNVETLANVPWIIEKGAEWFKSFGTDNSPGTKVFALTGKVKNTGLIEVPMGITIREIIFDIGGGVLDGNKFKAVQIGGPSGGCLPEQYLDLPVDFDSLNEVGAMMGSGGLVVMDEFDCVVDVARYFLSFTQVESCGKCPPCRIGTYEMLQIMNRITEGKGQPGDIERLEMLGKSIKETSLCGLGKSAPNPVLSTIAHFRDEYEAHIAEKYCPANVCTGLGQYRIVEEDCILCGLCKDVCIYDSVIAEGDRYYIDTELCTACAACTAVCPQECIKVERKDMILR